MTLASLLAALTACATPSRFPKRHDAASRTWPMYQLSQNHKQSSKISAYTFAFDARARINVGLATYRDKVIFDTLQGDVATLQVKMITTKRAKSNATKRRDSHDKRA
jgi:hypothetical protein